MPSFVSKTSQVYPGAQDPIDVRTYVEVDNGAPVYLGVKDGKLVVVDIPAVPETAVTWDQISGKPTLFPTTWNLVANRPYLSIPAGGVIDFFGNAMCELTGVFDDDAAKILLLDGGSSIQPYWRVCDGTNGTPDLRGRFRLGAGQGAGLTDRTFGDTGGEEDHALTIAEIPLFAPAVADGGNGGYVQAPIGTGDPHNTMPPFYVCYPIMRTDRQ